MAWLSLQLNSSRRACCSSFEIACAGGRGGGGRGGGIVGIVGAFGGGGSGICGDGAAGFGNGGLTDG